jgi:type IV secretory pathway protease TraF
MPGDEVCVHAEGLWVNQQPYGAVHQTWRGQPLPVFWGCHTVGEGEVFVASRVPQSLDGRYVGMTRVAETRLAIPVWTWR